MLNQQTVEKLQKIVAEHRDAIKLPQIGQWESMSDNDIWLAIVEQVGVVGNSAPAERMMKNLRAREKWYEAIAKMKPAQRRKEIHKVLNSFGIRYVSEDPEKCRKTNALLKNLALVESYGGPKAYIERISRIPDEHLRVSSVIEDMSYIENKGARDFLTGLGLIENAIAFDVRIKNVLVSCGAKLPENLGTDKAVYKALESELIEKVCKPCGVPGAVLDRVLYQKYKEIIAQLQKCEAY
jgi:hypothetical protein